MYNRTVGIQKPKSNKKSNFISKLMRPSTMEVSLKRLDKGNDFTIQPVIVVMLMLAVSVRKAHYILLFERKKKKTKKLKKIVQLLSKTPLTSGVLSSALVSRTRLHRGICSLDVFHFSCWQPRLAPSPSAAAYC